MVIGSLLLLMVTPYLQETMFLLAEQTTILSCSNGLFLIRQVVVNMKQLQHLEIC
jgi:hypothetical protein